MNLIERKGILTTAIRGLQDAANGNRIMRGYGTMTRKTPLGTVVSARPMRQSNRARKAVARWA